MSGLWNPRQVAEFLNVSPETVLRWHRSGKLPGGHRLSSNVLRFDRDELDAWLDEECKQPGKPIALRSRP